MFAGRSFAAAPRGAVRRLSQHAHDVAFLHDQQFLAVELDFGAGPFAEQDAVADLEVDRDQLAGFIPAAGSHRRDFALRGLFLGGVGNDDAALGLLFSVDTFDHDTVMQWAKCGFSHDGSFGGLILLVICRRKQPWNTCVFDTVEAAYSVILSIKRLDCQLRDWAIWPRRDPVKQTEIKA